MTKRFILALALVGILLALCALACTTPTPQATTTATTPTPALVTATPTITPTLPITTTTSNLRGMACSLACADHEGPLANQMCIQNCLKADPISILELLID